MQNLTNSKQEEQSTTFTNADVNHKQNSALIDRFPIENTPFVVWSDYRGERERHYLTMGEFKMSPDCDTQEEARQWPENHLWELIISMIVSVTQKAEELRKIQEEIPQG